MDSTPVHRSDCPHGKKESEDTSQHASLPSLLHHEAVSTINDWRKICSVTVADGRDNQRSRNRNNIVRVLQQRALQPVWQK